MVQPTLTLQRLKKLQAGAKAAGYRLRLTKSKPPGETLKYSTKSSLPWSPSPEKIQAWWGNISSFWESPQWIAPFNSRQIGAVYDSHIKFDGVRDEDCLRKRFLLIFFFDLYRAFSRVSPDQARVYIVYLQISFLEAALFNTIMRKFTM
jgi:hypothetical protein